MSTNPNECFTVIMKPIAVGKYDQIQYNHPHIFSDRVLGHCIMLVGESAPRFPL